MCFGKKIPKNCNNCLTVNVKHCLDFSFVFSAPLPAWRNLFSASGIFWWRYQPGCTGIFWPAEGTRKILLYLGKEPEYRPALLPFTTRGRYQENSALLRKRTWVQALLRFTTHSLGLPASGMGLYSGPSPIQKVIKMLEVTIFRHWVLGGGQNIEVKMPTILSDM
jgi:hypothetical protein